MLRLKNLEDWKKVDVGKKLVLPSEGERKVRLEVNSTGPVVLSIASSCGKRAKFECVVSGYEVLEFVACDKYEVTGNKPFYCYTVEGEQVHVEHYASESYVELKIRRPRNRELEKIVARANLNSERRMQVLLAEHEAHLAELQKEETSKKENVNDNTGQGDSGANGEGTEQAEDGGASPGDTGPESDSATAEGEAGSTVG